MTHPMTYVTKTRSGYTLERAPEGTTDILGRVIYGTCHAPNGAAATIYRDKDNCFLWSRLAHTTECTPGNYRAFRNMCVKLEASVPAEPAADAPVTEVTPVEVAAIVTIARFNVTVTSPLYGTTYTAEKVCAGDAGHLVTCLNTNDPRVNVLAENGYFDAAQVITITPAL